MKKCDTESEYGCKSLIRRAWDRWLGTERMEHTNMKPKNTICLWFDMDAHEAARFAARRG